MGFMVVALMFAFSFTLKTEKVNAADCTITKTLRLKMTDAQVVCLQQNLNALGYTVSTTGAGSVGMESKYFGTKTLAAVKAFQVANVLTPDGIFGEKGRAALLVAAPSTTTTTTTTTTTSTTGCPAGAMYNSITGVLCSSATTTTTTNPTGPVSVMLASDNPAAGTIVAGQATADLLHATFTGTGTISAITLNRKGISDQSTLSNVYLYDGMTRLTDGYSFNNAGVLTMGSLNIPVTGTKTLSIRADVYSSTTSYDISVNMVSYTVTGGTATTVNVAGNDMYIATGANLATATFSANTVGVSSSPAVNPGTTGYAVWSAPLQINGTHSLMLKSANFRIIGSAPTDALSNVKLYNDGVAIGSIGTMTMANGSNYVTFDMSGIPVELTTGSHTLDVRADIQKGSARTVQLSLQQASDLMVYDSQVGVNVAVAGTPNTTVYAISINQGSMTATIDPSFQAYTKVTGGSTNVTIAKFKLYAYGEDMKVNTLHILPVLGTMTPPSPAGLQNVTVYFNGSQVGSQTASWTSGNINLTPGSQMIVPAGVDSTLEVKADMRDTGSINYTNGTIHANIVAVTGGAEGMSSRNSLDIPGVTGNTLSVQTGLLAVGANTGYGNQILNKNTANVKLGSYTLQNQSTSESINVTSLRVTTTFAVPTFTLSSSVLTTGASSSTIKASATASFSAGDVVSIPTASTAASCTIVSVDSATSMTATCTAVSTGTNGASITNTSKTATAITYINGLRTTETSGSGSTPIAPTGIDTFSVNFVLNPGAVKTIDIMADLGGADYGTIITKLAPQGIGSSSHIAVYANGNTSLTDSTTYQTMTLSTGSLTVPATANPVSSVSTATQYVNAGTTGVSNATVAGYKFVSSNGSSTITELKFTVTGPVTSITVGGQTAPVAGSSVDVTGLNLSVPNGSIGATFPVSISYGSVGAAGIGTGLSGATSAITLTEVDYTIGGTASSTCASGCTTVMTPLASPTMKLVGAKPVLTATTTSGTTLTNNGDTHLMDVTVTPTGDLTVNVLTFTVIGNSAGTATLASPRLTDTNGTTLTDFVCLNTGATAAATDMKGADDTVTCTASSGYLVSTAKTFSLYGTPSFGTFGVSPTSSITAKLKQDAGATFSWTDTMGGATSAETTNNTTYLYAWPTATWSLHN